MSDMSGGSGLVFRLAVDRLKVVYTLQRSFSVSGSKVWFSTIPLQLAAKQWNLEELQTSHSSYVILRHRLVVQKALLSSFAVRRATYHLGNVSSIFFMNAMKNNTRALKNALK